jgi:formylglycine-generating enzyme required for sulfatase activity
MLYQPNILAPDRAAASPKRVYYAKRSNEMIYRSWERLETYVQSNHNVDASDLAQEIREKWWGEFEQTILEGQLGEDLIAVAEAVKRHFLEIPGGTVRLGSTKERQEWPELIAQGKRDLLDFQRDDANLEKLFDKYPFYRTRAGRVLRAKQTPLFLKLAEQPESEESIRAYLAERYGHAVGEPKEMQLSAFQLGRQTISNGWYHLYDSRHPNKHSNYSQYSPSPDHPAVALSFYDAWVYSQWLRWDGQSCRLPFEAEWEYAAKIGYPDWALEYWWEDAQDLDKPKHDFSADRIICWETRLNKESEGMTEIPSAKRASPGSKKADPLGEGLKDMQGNTWEWCMDAWQPNSIGNPPETTINPHPGNASVYRVLRGGSFIVLGRQASASYRYHSDPTVTYIYNGLRLARAPDRKS